jgi:hypothetical protein
MRTIRYLSIFCFAPTLAWAQSGSAPSTAVPPDAEQIASAVQALPNEYRATAKVLGYRTGSDKLVTLREGKTFTCLASNPANKNFHVACYHQSLEPFMARGRDLRAQGVKDPQVDTVRFAEIKAGKLPMPNQAGMYQIFGGKVDPATGTVAGGQALFVMYLPNATPASTGLSAKPQESGPWIMFPGTPKAHIMLTPKM